MDVADIKLPVPLQYRRGSLRKDEAKSLESAIRLLGWVETHHPVAGARILDFGCGVKISQALYQMDSPQAEYVGLDVYGEMITFLQGALGSHDKYDFHTVPFQNEMYNPDGAPMTPTSDLPVGDTLFDIQLMFSVITHMVPQDSAATLAILRRYIAPTGKLLFWAFADPDQAEDFRDDNPARPLLRAKYSEQAIEKIIAEAGWTIAARRVMETAHRKVRYICTPN